MLSTSDNTFILLTKYPVPDNECTTVVFVNAVRISTYNKTKRSVVAYIRIQVTELQREFLITTINL